MSKIGLIIGREFNQRVRKRSFIITTILTPLLMLGIMIVPVMLSRVKSEKPKTIYVEDRSGIILPSLTDAGNVLFVEAEDMSYDQFRENPKSGSGFLYIGEDIVSNPGNIRLYTFDTPTLDVENLITSQVRSVIEREKLKAYNIEDLQKILDDVRTHVSMQSFRIDSGGGEKQSSSGMSMAMGYIFGILIYMFVFFYGSMVMHGVIEEKSSKVLEVIVSSVRPFQLMMGKILGIGAVAITQFFIWIVFIFVVGSAAMQFFAGDVLSQGAAAAGNMPQGMTNLNPESVAALKTVTDVGFLLRILGVFLIYFIGGYLLYSAMFAAIGSAVDNPQDAQQLMMPVTIPLILAIMIMMGVVMNPHSTIAVWTSIIPLTSPVIMMARIPYGVPAWELILSVALLYGSFVFMVWAAGKIYRVGIFMYGKKPSFKELYKWATYKD